jgi:cell wall-associated NlpC family hydrolase
MSMAVIYLKNRILNIARIQLMLISSILLFSCAITPPGYYYFPDQQGARNVERVEKPKTEQRQQSLSSIQQKLYEGAQHFLGKEELWVGGKQYTKDCSGTVSAIYAYAGLDLQKLYVGYTGGGTQRMFNALKDMNLLLTQNPQVGDLIFWDNTYDSNGNGKWDDYLTHVGMVVKVNPNGSLQYVHDHVIKGITIEYMDLNQPDTWKKELNGKTVEINSPMRMNSNSTMNTWLASHHFRAFGRAFRVP